MTGLAYCFAWLLLRSEIFSRHLQLIFSQYLCCLRDYFTVWYNFNSIPLLSRWLFFLKCWWTGRDVRVYIYSVYYVTILCQSAVKFLPIQRYIEIQTGRHSPGYYFLDMYILFPKNAYQLGSSGLSTWKYQFSYDHWSRATLSSVSTTWMGDCSSVAWMLLLTP